MGDERDNENDNNLMVLFVFNMNFNKLKIDDYTALLKLNNYRHDDIKKLYQLNDADLQSSFNYIDNDFDAIDAHFTSLLLNKKNVKINTASHYVGFVNDINTENINDDFINYMLLRIKCKLGVYRCYLVLINIDKY